MTRPTWPALASRPARCRHEPNRPNWVRVATIVNEVLPDLVGMPSEPTWQRAGQEFGTLVVKSNGQERPRL